MNSRRLLGLLLILAALGGIIWGVTCRLVVLQPVTIADTVKKDIELNKIIHNELSDTCSLDGMNSQIERYMRQWQLRGASLSIMRNDSLLFSKGYGWADEEKGARMDASHIMRVASVSKLITAAGIMVLQEQGKLSLKDTVFGPHAILKDSSYLASIRDKNYYKITVEQLLRHEGGFRGFDPMFNTRSIMNSYQLEKAPDTEELVKIVLKRRLRFIPGSSRYYSNFGYLLLSMVIESASGQPYEKFIQENVLRPAGCFDMHIAKNYYSQKYRNEVRYYVPSNEPMVEEYNNSGKMVIRCYGGNNIEGLQGAGAWVCSTPELARFIASIDGNPTIPDIISKESVKLMTAYYDRSTYSLGWNDTNPKVGWTRTGTLSGTTALIKYFPDGECWIFVSNNSTWKGPGFTRYTSNLFSKLRSQYSEKLPPRNLFWKR